MDCITVKGDNIQAILFDNNNYYYYCTEKKKFLNVYDWEIIHRIVNDNGSCAK